MSNYWPGRPSPEGFSIEKLAQNYKERLYRRAQNVYVKPQVKNRESNLNYGHWANRDFQEYREAA